MKIAVIGFGKLGQQLLIKGLQYNIFSADQRLEYHIFGDGEQFRRLYRSLDQIDDTVIFHEDRQYDYDLIQNADMIILADMDGEVSHIRNTLFAVNEKKIHVLTNPLRSMPIFHPRIIMR